MFTDGRIVDDMIYRMASLAPDQPLQSQFPPLFTCHTTIYGTKEVARRRPHGPAYVIVRGRASGPPLVVNQLRDALSGASRQTRATQRSRRAVSQTQGSNATARITKGPWLSTMPCRDLLTQVIHGDHGQKATRAQRTSTRAQIYPRRRSAPALTRRVPSQSTGTSTHRADLVEICHELRETDQRKRGCVRAPRAEQQPIA